MELTKACNGEKTGKYTLTDAPRQYPWIKEKEGFKLKSEATNIGPGMRLSMLPMIQDKARYRSLVRSLSRGKAPGKDGITNELLRNLPDRLLDAIHDVFVLRFIFAKLPENRKASETILLYKKEDPSDIRNYRPIALADTVTNL